jgi:molybdate transport system ATP-binding protein
VATATHARAELEIDVALRRGAAAMRFAFTTRARVTGVFGASGAGKTTLLHVIAGLARPDSGRVRVGERVLFDAARRIDVPVHQRGAGVVFQDDRLLPHLTVAGNLRYGAPRARAREARTGGGAASLDAIADVLDLRPLLRRRVAGLSGGERKRVAIGRALLSSPSVLLLDEPLASLDRARADEILALLLRLRDVAPMPILHVSHDIGEILRLTDEVVVIDGGRSVGHGPYREVLRTQGAWPALRALGPVNVIAARVAGHDDAAALTRFAVASVEIVAPRVDRAPGAAAFLSIRPEDVALSLERLAGVSIRNQIRGRVTVVTAHPDRAIVEVEIGGGAILLVEVSRQTVAQMALHAEREVWCLVKSNAVRVA